MLDLTPFQKKWLLDHREEILAWLNSDHPLVRQTITTLEQALNQPVRCRDGAVRRLVLIEDKLLHYEVPTPGGSWMRLSGTRRWEAEPLFIGGTLET